MRLGGDWAPGLRCVQPLPWADALIANLEGPVIQAALAHSPAVKVGPHLAHGELPSGPETCVLSLANNHTMDYGETGLVETFARLDGRGFLALGAGRDLASAARPITFDWRGVRVGILSRCETQFGVATDRQPGVAPLGVDIYRSIRELRTKSDVVVVSVHAAAEICPWPSPNRQDAWRALVEAGADIVHGHHAHVPQGWEHYEGGYIFYGLGNLCVDPALWVNRPNTLWSLAPELIWSSGDLEMRIRTAVIDDLGVSVRVRDATDDESDSHQTHLSHCNRPLDDRQWLEALWQEASVRMYRAWYADWLGWDRSRVISIRQAARALSRRGRDVIRRLRSSESRLPEQRQRLLGHVLFACESHRDAIATALGVLGGALEDRRTKETAELVDAMMPDIGRG